MLDEPTPRLRFVKRHERFILQQQWRVVRGGSLRYEWRDVPVEDENESVG